MAHHYKDGKKKLRQTLLVEDKQSEAKVIGICVAAHQTNVGEFCFVIGV